jgi:hypothetical protein
LAHTSEGKDPTGRRGIVDSDSDSDDAALGPEDGKDDELFLEGAGYDEL